jgi:hypothetical protein
MSTEKKVMLRKLKLALSKTIVVLAIAAAGFSSPASAALSVSAPDQSAVAKWSVVAPPVEAGVADGADSIKMPRIRVAPNCQTCGGHKG